MPIRQEGTQVTVNAELISALSLSLSSARLHLYREKSSFDDAKALALYLWNVKIGQAFHFPVQSAEITVRNSISRVLVTLYGVEWWTVAKFENALDEEAKAELRTAEQRIKKKGLPYTSDQMVAALSFGFWGHVLGQRHYPLIWSKYLKAAFPKCPPINFHLPKIRDRLFDVLSLRNKIFHHEPLINLDLTKEFSEILELINWICPVTSEWVRKSSCVPLIIRERPR